MSRFDYETFKGYCGICREILDWKKVLSDIKEFEEQKKLFILFLINK